MSTIDFPEPDFSEDEATIRARMLEAIDPDLNKDDGDLVYDMVSPAAAELAQAHDRFVAYLQQAFAHTATGTYLDLIAAQLTPTITRNTDEEDDDFRTRILTRLEAPPSTGSVSDWKTWALEQTEVPLAYVTVTPLASGAGTLTITAAKANRAALSAGEQSDLETYFESIGPALADVTVDTITEDSVTVTATVQLQEGYILDTTLSTAITDSITTYIESLSPGEDVLVNEVIWAVMDVDGVFDIDSLDIGGGGASDYAISATELASAGAISISAS